jgi:hypothetical protein
MKAHVQSTTIPTGIDTPSAIFAEVDSPGDVAPDVLLERRLVEVVDDELTSDVDDQSACDVDDFTEVVVRDTVTFGTIGENSSSAPASSYR